MNLARTKVGFHGPPYGAILIPLDVIHALDSLVEGFRDGLVGGFVVAFAEADQTLTVAYDDERVHGGHLSLGLHGHDALDDQGEAVQVANVVGGEMGELSQVGGGIILAGQVVDQVRVGTGLSVLFNLRVRVDVGDVDGVGLGGGEGRGERVVRVQVEGGIERGQVFGGELGQVL